MRWGLERARKAKKTSVAKNSAVRHGNDVEHRVQLGGRRAGQANRAADAQVTMRHAGGSPQCPAAMDVQGRRRPRRFA